MVSFMASAEIIRYKSRQFTVVEVVREVKNRLIKRDLVRRADGVVVVAVDEENNVILLREFCAGAPYPVLSLPGGKVASDSASVEEEALRELREETGLVASELIPLHKTYFAPSIMERRLYIFLARGLKKAKTKHIKRDADILEVVRMPINQAIKLLQKDFVTDSTTLGYILLAKLKMHTDCARAHEV
jgi:ADP-ribose pyrophosphatase